MEAIGTTEYSADLIQSKLFLQSLKLVIMINISEGCQTYKKTLASREKQSSTPIRNTSKNIVFPAPGYVQFR